MHLAVLLFGFCRVFPVTTAELQLSEAPPLPAIELLKSDSWIAKTEAHPLGIQFRLEKIRLQLEAVEAFQLCLFKDSKSSSCQC